MIIIMEYEESSRIMILDTVLILDRLSVVIENGMMFASLGEGSGSS